MRFFLSFWSAALWLGAIAIMPQPGLPQSYPDHPITLVVPYPAGGGNDVLARLVAEKMSKATRAIHRGREPRRRRRHHRDAASRQEPARWLHATDRHQLARHQPVALSECRLRSAQGFCPNRPDRV